MSCDKCGLVPLDENKLSWEISEFISNRSLLEMKGIWELAHIICSKFATPAVNLPSKIEIKELIRNEIIHLNKNVFSKTEVIQLQTAVVLEDYIATTIHARLFGKEVKGQIK